MINLNQFSDSQLLTLLQKKDKTAFIVLYDTYAPLLYGAILKWFTDEAIAKEMLQKSFLKIWEECSTIDCHNKKLFTWMYALVFKLTRDELAKQEHSQQNVDELVA